MRSGGNEGAMSRGSDGGQLVSVTGAGWTDLKSGRQIFRRMQREANNKNSKELCFISRYQTQVAVVETR